MSLHDKPSDEMSRAFAFICAKKSGSVSSRSICARCRSIADAVILRTLCETLNDGKSPP